MTAVKPCMRCFAGKYVDGKCIRCGHSEQLDRQTGGLMLPVGTMLHGRYYIGVPIGQGGFGITYAAWDAQTKNRVVVKELFPRGEVSRGEDGSSVKVLKGHEAMFRKLFDCFTKEANNLIQLKSQEGVVNIYHAFEQNNTGYYVMEYLEGEDLKHRMAAVKTVSWDEMQAMLRILLPALDALHGKGLIHRDISPDNIFLANDGKVWLIDFGSVRSFEGSGKMTRLAKQSFSPWEQISSQGKQGPWTDIYSLCVTVYYALTGELPPSASARRMGSSEVQLLNQRCSGVPEHAAAAIAKGMEVQPEHRFQTVEEMVQALFPGENLVSRELKQTAPPKTVPSEKRREPAAPHKGYLRINCIQGVFHGQKWELHVGETLRVGRLPNLDVVYPVDTMGVSRQQCTFRAVSEHQIMVRDEKSSYGTYLIQQGSSIRMEPGQWYSANGCWVCFGQKEEYWIQ